MHAGHHPGPWLRVLRMHVQLAAAMTWAGVNAQLAPTPAPFSITSSLLGCDTLLAVGSANFGFEILGANCTAGAETLTRALRMPPGLELQCVPTPLGRAGTVNYLGASTSTCNTTAASATTGLGTAGIALNCDPSPYLAVQGSLSSCRAVSIALQRLVDNSAQSTTSPTPPPSPLFACYQPSALNPQCTLGQGVACECPQLRGHSQLSCEAVGAIWALYVPPVPGSVICDSQQTTLTTTLPVSTPQSTALTFTSPGATSTREHITATQSTPLQRSSQTDDSEVAVNAWYTIVAAVIAGLLCLMLIVAVVRCVRDPPLSKEDSAQLAALSSADPNAAPPSLRIVVSSAAESEIVLAPGSFPDGTARTTQTVATRRDKSGVGREFSQVTRNNAWQTRTDRMDTSFAGSQGSPIGSYLDETET